MTREFILQVNGVPVRVLAQQSFFDKEEKREEEHPLHRHTHAEIHMICRGEMEFAVADEHLALKAGDVLLINAGVFHRPLSVSRTLHRMPFLVDAEGILPGFVAAFPKEYLAMIAQRVENWNRGDPAEFTAFLGAVCAPFLSGDDPGCVSHDRELTVDEFFAQNYDRDATLADLGAELNLSEKQADRLVRQVTGRGFREELCSRRMEAARQLIREGEMSLAAIAEQVGYRSYSGFWKALQRWGEE